MLSCRLTVTLSATQTPKLHGIWLVHSAEAQEELLDLVHNTLALAHKKHAPAIESGCTAERGRALLQRQKEQRETGSSKETMSVYNGIR